MQTRRAWMLAGLMAGGGGAVQAAPPLRFALGQSWGPPFVERRGSRLVGGLLPELMQLIAAEAGREADLRLLPPARVETAIEQGQVDLHCVLSRSWWREVQDDGRWSPPLLRLRDLLVAAPDGPADAAALQASGPWTVGTVRGYRYPLLDPEFAAGRLMREDAYDQSAVLEKLARRRTPVGVINELALKAYQDRRGGVPLRVLRVVEEVEAHCLISRAPQVPAAELQALLRRVARGAPLQALLQRYGASAAERRNLSAR